MTSEKLYGILKFLDTLNRELGLQKSLEQIGASLTNLVSAPAQPQQQAALAQALEAFETAVAKMNTIISPSQMAAISAMGGGEFFDPSLYEKVKVAVQSNAMTPSVARDYVQELAQRRAQFLAIVQQARTGLEGLGLEDTGLEKGTADVAFIIPRKIFDNELGRFSKELEFINRLIEHYSEAITGEAKAAELEELSSSVPTLALLAALPVLNMLGSVINKFLDAWKKIEEIRELRQRLSTVGLKGVALEQLTDQISTTVDELVEESTELVITHYKGDDGRKRELKIAVKQDTRRLFGQIERGLIVEFRVKQDGNNKDEDQQKMLENLGTYSAQMKFPEIANEPVLLTSGELLEGDIASLKDSKKTTIKTTMASRKSRHKEPPSEARS